MIQGLSLQRQLQGSPKEYVSLSGRALQIVLEKSHGWNALLLAQLIADEVANAVDLRLSYDARVSFGPGERVRDGDFLEWRWAVCDQAARLVTSLDQLMTKALDEAVSAGDGPRIASCVRLVGRGYREAMEWAVGVRRAHVAADCRAVVEARSLFTRDIVEQVEGSRDASAGLSSKQPTAAVRMRLRPFRSCSTSVSTT